MGSTSRDPNVQMDDFAHGPASWHVATVDPGPPLIFQ